MRFVVTCLTVYLIKWCSCEIPSYSQLILDSPFPKLDGLVFGQLEDETRDSGDGGSSEQEQSSDSVDGDDGIIQVSRAEQARENKQRMKQTLEGDDVVTFGHQKHGRFEFEDGERYEEKGDQGVGRERRWYWGKEGPNFVSEEDGGDKLPGMRRQKQRLTRYNHKRRRNFSNIQHDSKVLGNKVKVGDLSRFKKIHGKHFGSKNTNEDNDQTNQRRRGGRKMRISQVNSNDDEKQDDGLEDVTLNEDEDTE